MRVSERCTAIPELAENLQHFWIAACIHVDLLPWDRDGRANFRDISIFRHVSWPADSQGKEGKVRKIEVSWDRDRDRRGIGEDVQGDRGENGHNLAVEWLEI